MSKHSILSKVSWWNQRIDRITAVICGILVLVMMLTVVIDVGGRYLFNKPLVGGVEVATNLVVAIVFLSLAYVQLEKRHITIDFVIKRLPARVQDTADFIFLIVMLVIISFVTWRFVDDAMMSWRTGEATYGLVAVPYAPIRTLLAFSFALFGLCVLVQILNRIAKVDDKN